MQPLRLLVLSVCVLFSLISGSSIPSIMPLQAQNYPATGACGPGDYWLVEGGGWQSVWLPRGANAFVSHGAFWQQDDVSGSGTIAINGDAVTVSHTYNPNVWGTLTCTHTGTLRPDGISVVGTSTCQLDSGISTALSWSAKIMCGAPTITWSDSAFWHRAAKGEQFNFICPPGGFAAPVWGTGTYIEGASICAAGVHAGAITLADGGLVTIEILPGEASYPGSAANGITSETFPTAGQFDAGFRVVNGAPLATATTTPAVATTPDPLSTPTATPEGQTTYPNLYGIWQSSYGVMNFQPDRAIYGNAATNSESYVYYTLVDEFTIEGHWVQPNGSGVTCTTEVEGSKWWGRFRATFQPGFATFEGQWGYCEEEPGGYWNGWR